MRYVRYLCIAIFAVALVSVALANRGAVSLQILPAEVSGLFAMNPSIELPLFVVILGSILTGLLIGFVWEWIREYGERAEAARQAREMRRLQREIDKLKAEKHEGKDEVIALLDKAGEVTMPDDIAVKICGLREPAHVLVAAEAGARYVGFVFFPKSPRHLEISEAAALAAQVPAGLCKVALTVDADDAMLDRLLQGVPIDMLQLHGRESPERVAQVKARYGLPVMKAVGVGARADLADLDAYADVADQILVDAKPPTGGDLPGGNGLAFDWTLLERRVWRCPWMLAGGLTPLNVAEAIRRTGARQVDVSSGVESSAGVKDAALIHALVAAALYA